MTRYATLALAGMLAGLAIPALAQAIPPGQSCGGLLCDMGVFGHKVTPGPNGEPASPERVATEVAAAEAADPHRLPCHDFLCRAFGQKDADAAPPPPPPVAAAAPEPAAPAKKVRKRRVAKAQTAAAQ